MPALTSAGVVRNDYGYEGDFVGSKRKVVDVTLTLVSQGGLTNSIPASLFGLRTITEAKAFRSSSSVATQFGPSYDGSTLVAYAIETNGNPADITATVRGLVIGKE